MPIISAPQLTDAAAAIASLRTLGTGASQAAPGNRFGSYALALGTIAGSTPSSHNLSTEGTIDWLDSNGLSSFNYSANAGLLHKKIDGAGTMFRTFQFFAGGATGVTVSAFTDGPFTKTTTAADDMAAAALSATSYSCIFSANASQVGYGFLFDVPCRTTSQTLNLYAGVWHGTATISATLPDGTTVSTTLTNTTASVQRKIPFIFSAQRPGELLRVKAVLTTNNASSPNVQFYDATLFPTP